MKQGSSYYLCEQKQTEQKKSKTKIEDTSVIVLGRGIFDRA